MTPSKELQLVDTPVLRAEKTDLEAVPSTSDQGVSEQKNATPMTFEENSPKQKRIKERKVGEIMEIVAQWRKLYLGFVDPETGKIIKMTLDQAALKVGISKKSLDDYLLQIR